MNNHIDAARTLADDVLLARVKGLAARERGATAELVAHLAEVETRNLHVASGYASMYAYCRDVLKLTDHEAFNRIEVARAGRRFPLVLDRLAEGAVSLTAVRLLAPHLTADNHAEVLESARGMSRSEVEKIVARLAPMPDVATTVRKLPAPRSAKPPAAESSPTAATSPTAPVAVAQDLLSIAPVTGASPTPTSARVETRPAVVNALSPDRYKLQLTISGETLERLELAKDMMRHANPSGDVAEIVNRALALLVDDLARKKFAATDQPRGSKGVAAESHKVSARVRRVVWVRDLGRCAFVGKDGHRCNERVFLEFHHVKPHAHDGPPTVDNIELRCRRHNLYEWEREYTEVRIQEDEWLRRQGAAGIVPARASRTRFGTSTASRAAVFRQNA
jgi:hypothetical protein